MISVSRLISKIIFFLILYIPLEELFLKWLPVPDSIFESLHVISDFFIAVIIFLFLYLSSSRSRFRLTITKLTLTVFLLVAFFSFLMSFASFAGYFSKIWVLLRYIFIYFILLNIKLNKEELNRFYLILGVSFCIQIFIGLLLLLDISYINLFFEAREGVLKIIVPEDTIKGTFKFGVFYGFFVMVSFVILYPYTKSSFVKVVLVTTSIIFTYYSGSRVAFLGVIGYILYRHFRENKVLIFTMVCGFIVFIFASGIAAEVDNIGSLLGLFSADFWLASLSSGRLGIFNIVPMFFDASIKEILFGFSYDVTGITSFLYQDYDNLSAILKNNAIVGIEDVYWIAFLYYYGIFGILLFAMFYANFIFKVNRLFLMSHDSEHRMLIQSIKYLVAFAVIVGFVNQVFHIKTFAFYFWVFAAVATHRARFYTS